MKRAWVIFCLGIILAVAAWAGVFRGLMRVNQGDMLHGVPELNWLRQEFQLDTGEFARVSRLHEAHIIECARICREIDDTTGRLRKRLATDRDLTPEVNSLLEKRAALRLQCQKLVLRHVLDTSRVMQTEHGKRYLAWVQGNRLILDHQSVGEMRHGRVMHEH